MPLPRWRRYYIIFIFLKSFLKNLNFETSGSQEFCYGIVRLNGLCLSRASQEPGPSFSDRLISCVRHQVLGKLHAVELVLPQLVQSPGWELLSWERWLRACEHSRLCRGPGLEPQLPLYCATHSHLLLASKGTHTDIDTYINQV